jgi:hypothetical protein
MAGSRLTILIDLPRAAPAILAPMTAPAHHSLSILLLLLSAAPLTACTLQPNLHDPDPALKIPAMKRAADRHDLRQREILVQDLDNDDAAIRFYAISALERLTGTRRGYDYYADEPARHEAVRRWRNWLTQSSPVAATQQAGK